jgi:diacylglycerol kinase
LSHAYKTQRNLRLHLAVTSLVVALGLWLRLQPLEWAALLLAIGLVIATELLNSALEALADIISPDHHERVGVAKDVAAGAVLVSAVAAVLVGVLVLGPRLLALLWR